MEEHPQCKRGTKYHWQPVGGVLQHCNFKVAEENVFMYRQKPKNVFRKQRWWCPHWGAAGSVDSPAGTGGLPRAPESAWPRPAGALCVPVGSAEAWGGDGRPAGWRGLFLFHPEYTPPLKTTRIVGKKQKKWPISDVLKYFPLKEERAVSYRLSTRCGSCGAGCAPAADASSLGWRPPSAARWFHEGKPDKRQNSAEMPFF